MVDFGGVVAGRRISERQDDDDIGDYDLEEMAEIEALYGDYHRDIGDR